MRKLHRLWQYPVFVVFIIGILVTLPITAGIVWIAVRVGHEIVGNPADNDEELA